ncbi:unnamed protein product, partial [Mycena citricolor]
RHCDIRYSGNRIRRYRMQVSEGFIRVVSQPQLLFVLTSNHCPPDPNSLIPISTSIESTNKPGETARMRAGPESLWRSWKSHASFGGQRSGPKRLWRGDNDVGVVVESATSTVAYLLSRVN